MKCVGKITIGLVSGLALSASLHADDIALNDNPYASVVTRNIFGLLPPPPPVDPNAQPPEAPIKISLNGIMFMAGQLQALFKASGQPPAKEGSYILAEGEGQDEIEVTKIDDKNGSVTFNNHGVVEVIALAAAKPATSAPVTSGIPSPFGGRNPVMPGLPTTRSMGAGFNDAFGGRHINGGGNNPGMNNGANVIPAAPHSAFIQQPQSSLSADEQTVAIEVNREVTKQQVIEGSMPPLPPTELTPEDATSVGGAPLIAPLPTAPPP